MRSAPAPAPPSDICVVRHPRQLGTMEWSLGTRLHTLAAGDTYTEHVEVRGKLSVKEKVAEVICNGVESESVGRSDSAKMVELECIIIWRGSRGWRDEDCS